MRRVMTLISTHVERWARWARERLTFSARPLRPLLNPFPTAAFCAVAALLTLGVPEVAQAANFGQGALPYEQPLTVIRQSVTGPIAFTMSVIGIVVAGIALVFGGDLGGFIRQMVMLVLAISVVVGATNLMGSLFGQGAVVGSRVELQQTTIRAGHQGRAAAWAAEPTVGAPLAPLSPPGNVRRVGV